MSSIIPLLKNLESLIQYPDLISEDIVLSLESEIQDMINNVLQATIISNETLLQYEQLRNHLFKVGIWDHKLCAMGLALQARIGAYRYESYMPVAPSDLAIEAITAPVPPVLRPIRANPINLNELNAWIDAHDAPEAKKALRELTGLIRCISQNEFEATLSKTVQCLNEFFAEEGGAYVIAIENGKSNQWLSQLALPHLHASPLEEISLIPKDFLVKFQKQKHTTAFPKHIVLFDDAAYSGEQLTRIIRGIFITIECFNKDLQNEEIPIPNVIVACPYMTQFAENAIKQGVKPLLVTDTNGPHSALEHLKILPYSRIMTIKELITDQCTLNILTQMWWPNEANLGKGNTPESRRKNNISGSSSRSASGSPKNRQLMMQTHPQKFELDRDLSASQFAHKKGVESRGTVYFEFKIPDKESFVGPLAEGRVVMHGRNIKSDKKFNIIPRTVPPYKPNFELFCKEIAENPSKG